MIALRWWSVISTGSLGVMFSDKGPTGLAILLVGSMLLLSSRGQAAEEAGESSRGAAPREEEAVLVTDRPGNGNAAETVAGLRLQLETSVQYVSDEGDFTQQLSAPTLIRFGVVDWAELRLASGLIGVDFQNGSASVHATDVVVGTKLSFIDKQWVNFATSVDVSLPSGNGPFDGQVVNPDARLLASFALPANFGLLLNTGADLPPEDSGGRVLRVLHVVNVGYVVPFWDERWSVFVESFGRHPVEGGGQIWQLDVGTALLLGPNTQIDLFSQHGLTEAAPDFQIAAGFSARW